MSFALQLGISSSTQLEVNPEADIRESDTKIQSTHRTEDGSELRYKWGEFGRVAFSVRYVNSSFKSIVNSWWSSNSELTFMRNDGTEVFSCKVEGDVKPIGNIDGPAYNDQFTGKITLGGY